MTSGLSRRRFLGTGAAAAAFVGAVGAAPFSGARRGPRPTVLLRSAAPLPPRYKVPLPVPRVLKPERSDGTTDYYSITARPAGLKLLPGHTTTVWGYEGTYPGPTIESRSGRRTVVTHHNHLVYPMVVHLHGGHTPHESDGYPMDLVDPAPSGRDGSGAGPDRDVASSRTYTYPMQQRPATLWYHDHTMGFTGPNVYRGLAGFHLVRDDDEEALGLPSGHRELPLMLADRSFNADGSLFYPALDAKEHKPGVQAAYMDGVLGDVVLVNGAPWPVAEVERARYRLRFLNASNSRRFQLELAPQPHGGGGLVQIGSDAGLLQNPVAHDSLAVAPAERYDVVVDFSRYKAGTTVELVNRLGGGSTARVMRFDIGSAKVTDDSRVPHVLSAVDAPDLSQVSGHRTFTFRQTDGTWTINGRGYEPGRSLASPALGNTEIWRFVSDFHHPVHVHLDPFQVVSRGGRAPGAYDHGWKDTVDVDSPKGVEVMVRFTDYAGRFLLHCHNLEHEDMAMMADFDTY